MLETINDLKVFFEDCYRRVGVREYSRLVKISPPTASKILDAYSKEGLLSVEKYRNYIFYFANKSSKDFIDLSRIYWRAKLADFVGFIEREFVTPTIILFGSLSKAEVKIDSDIDLCILSSKKNLNFENFEKKLKRRIQVFVFKDIDSVNDENLRKSVMNGYVLSGRFR